MRDVKEIGEYTAYGDEVNQAYQTYASLYLDFVDDNPQKFFTRGLDDRPIKDSEEKDFARDYIQAALEIAKISMSSGYWKSFDELYEEYPLLKNYSEELENEFFNEEKKCEKGN